MPKGKYVRTKSKKHTKEPEKAVQVPEPELAPESIPEPEPTPVVETPPPPVEEKQVLCDCGKPANPGSNQCWGCSHRT